MSDNRVQKLLFSEYCDFEDMVLIESPFAQTTKDGKGIRQVHLGLTPSKLVLATDVLPPVEYVNFKYCPEVDPLIETFELIAIYPVECVNLSIYRTKKNQALKARFCNNKVLYFELGGFQNRAMFWNLWCEKVKFFCPNVSESSRSETSVGTSSSASTLYLLDRKFVAINGLKQLWCTFGPNPSLENSSLNETVRSQVKLKSRWTDRHLYLGKEFDLKYAPVMEPPSLDEFIHTPKSSKLYLRNKRSEVTSYMVENKLSIGDSVQINRFGKGIKEGCSTGLYLTVEDYAIPRLYSRMLDMDDTKSAPSFSTLFNFEHLAETAVLTWELYRATDPNKYKIKHRRRYALATQPTLLYGFRPFDTPKGTKYSLQMKRAVSEVCLARNTDYVFKTSLPKQQLTASVSHQLLATVHKSKCNRILTAVKSPLIYFWTPGYKYRPKSATQVYEERLKELKSIQRYQESLTTNRKRKRRRKSKFGRNFLCLYHNKIPKVETDDDSNEDVVYVKKPKKQGFIHSLFPYKEDANNVNFKKPNESPFQCLKRLLKVDNTVSAWDFDSTTLAEQLTLIDRNLFLKISPVELEILVCQKSSTSTPNISNILAFSQRVSDLLASAILKNDCVKARSRLISRFINVADKCHKFSNFQSCKSVLNGLQSPAIYRLRTTWAYLRKKHASKYRNFERLCRFYRDPRMLTYQKTFFILAHTPPFLPYIGDIFSRLLGKIPDYPFPYRTSSTKSISTFTMRSYQSEEFTETKRNSLFHRFLKAFALSQTNEVSEMAKRARTEHSFRKNKNRGKGLYEYYKPFDSFNDLNEDNLIETKAFLERCHLGAMNYNFPEDEKAKCYLLKARYQDDRENFVFSLSIDSPRNYYESKPK